MDKPEINVVWLKRNLRLQDNQALFRATQAKLPFLIVYLFEPFLLKDPHYDKRHWNFIRESLRDLFAVQDKQVGIDNIQRTVAEYYSIKVPDLLSKRRSRSVARPRQVAMALAKELTNHSYPEIGDAFGGRDHTTVLHACRKVKELQEENAEIREDYKSLLRALTS